MSAVACCLSHAAVFCVVCCQAYKDCGDNVKKGDRPWIAEMYGYSFGAAKSNVWHIWKEDFMLYPSYAPGSESMNLQPNCLSSITSVAGTSVIAGSAHLYHTTASATGTSNESWRLWEMLLLAVCWHLCVQVVCVHVCCRPTGRHVAAMLQC